MAESAAIEAWFIHDKLVLSLLPEQDLARLSVTSIPSDHPFAQAIHNAQFERIIVKYLTTANVSALDVEHLRRSLTVGQLVWFEQAIAFKGIGPARREVTAGKDGRASFTARLTTDPEVKVVGTYNAARVTSNTAEGELSGVKRQFMLGYINSIASNEIQLRPIVIARRWTHPGLEFARMQFFDKARVWPSQVDQFAEVDFGQRMKKSDLNTLRSVSETTVKEAFADILGEPDVPKDWGGEQFDFWTDRLSVDSERLQTAFAFKGPAKFGPMTIATLGKNGDQIDRLYQTAADLIVVQHCHSITAPVTNMLRIYATNPIHQRRFMTINGYETINILNHFGKI